MIVITLTKLGKNINAKIFDNTRNLEVNYYEDSSNLTLVYNVQNNTVTLSIKGTTSYTTPNVTTNNCLYYYNGINNLISDKTLFDTYYSLLFPASTGGGGTQNFDSVLAQGGQLTDTRQIDLNEFPLNIVGALNFAVQDSSSNGINIDNDTGTIQITNLNQSTPQSLYFQQGTIELLSEGVGTSVFNTAGTIRQCLIGDFGTNNGNNFGVDDKNNTLIANGVNITSNTAGLHFGQHLKININGNNYKIALLNP